MTGQAWITQISERRFRRRSRSRLIQSVTGDGFSVRFGSWMRGYTFAEFAKAPLPAWATVDDLLACLVYYRLVRDGKIIAWMNRWEIPCRNHS